MTPSKKSVTIIGAGPAGLMAAEVLSLAGRVVDVYDAMPTAGRKFLMAGKGGLNITHSEPFDRFLARYGTRQRELKPLLEAFSPTMLRAWVRDLGIETFVGTSGRVFPTEMKAAPLLRAWLHRLRMTGVRFHMRHRWAGWAADGQLRFTVPDGDKTGAADAVVLALGGASWPRLGSDAAWVPLLQQADIEVVPLRPANCGFDVPWTEFFRKKFAGLPVKAVRLTFGDGQGRSFSQTGEFVVTDHGLEGGLIYALSAPLRDEIEARGVARIVLDLSPDRSRGDVISRLTQSRGKASLTNHLRRRLNLDNVKIALLREAVAELPMDEAGALGNLIKSLPIQLLAARPLAEAISTAGGVSFSQIDDNLMLKARPGIFCAGEMLDWEAPTGGYLLTACLATGYATGKGVLRWLET